MMPDDRMQEIVLGNALDELASLPENSIDCIITEPPLYQRGVSKTLPPTFWPDGWKGVLGQEKLVTQYLGHLTSIFKQAHSVLKPTGTLWIIVQDTFSGETLYGIPSFITLFLLDQGWFLKNQIIWQHEKALIRHVGQRFTENYKVVLFLVKDRKKHYYEKQEEKSGKLFRTVWFGKMHEIMPIMVQAGCPKDGLVLDPFCGSGATCIEAHKLERSYVGIDLDQAKCDESKAALAPLLSQERLF